MGRRRADEFEVSAYKNGCLPLTALGYCCCVIPLCCLWACPTAGDDASRHCCGVTPRCLRHASFQFIHAKIWRMIAQALFTPAQQKLLGLLFVRVNEGFHLNEICLLYTSDAADE